MGNEKELVTFRKSYPIHFSLRDQDDQAVMYISEDRDDWTLQLTIENTSSQSITMAAGQGAASSTNHHFALRFRPGTLAKRTVDLLAGQGFANAVRSTDWVLAGPMEQPAVNEPVTLYLLYTGQDRVLAGNAPRSITLSGFSAAPGSGSRGTQVELLPGQIQYTPGGTAITDGRTQYLHVTNHSGRKNIPLHVGFVGGNRVLSDGKSESPLKLRLTNVLRSSELGQSTALTLRGSGARPSKLVLSYDAGDMDWALARAGAAKDVHVDAQVKASKVQVKKPSDDAKVVGNLQGQAPEWELTFAQDIPLESGQALDITLTGLVAAASSGQANLYLRYENIPGYWDGQFVCTVEKVPLIFEGGKVGIGKRSPSAALEVAGETKTATLTVTGKTALDFGPAGGLLFQGNNNGNPGIFALNAHQGLTICGDGGGELPKLALHAREVWVSGQLTSSDEYSWKNAAIGGGAWRAFSPVEFRKDASGTVHLRGSVFGGSDRDKNSRAKFTLLFRLPSPYWPKNTVSSQEAAAMRADWSHTTCLLELKSDGWLKIGNQDLAEDIRVIFLDGITFPAQ